MSPSRWSWMWCRPSRWRRRWRRSSRRTGRRRARGDPGGGVQRQRVHDLGPVRLSQVWCKELATRTRTCERWGGLDADGPRHPVDGMPAQNATQQLGEVGPWHLRLPPSGWRSRLVTATAVGVTFRSTTSTRPCSSSFDGPTVFANCAVDALGIAAKLGRDRHWTWQPADAVAFVGSSGQGRLTNTCCPVINFFTTDDHARAYQRAHRCIRVATAWTPALTFSRYRPIGTRAEPERGV